MKVPAGITADFEAELENIDFGAVALTVSFRYGKPRYEIWRKRSYKDETADTAGENNDRGEKQ